jgi:hypothetical protein
LTSYGGKTGRSRLALPNGKVPKKGFFANPEAIQTSARVSREPCAL